MPIDPAETLYYRQTRFTTRLPKAHRYARSHYWMANRGDGVVRVGLTKFATRMLGDFVELEFSVESGDSVEQGQPIGWVEGFKAQADIYSVAAGVFVAANPIVDREPHLVDNDPYDAGWLYEVRAPIPSDAIDCDGYAAILDATIQKMLDTQREEPSC